MKKLSSMAIVFALTSFFFLLSQQEAEAQRRGGSNSGTYQRSNARGQGHQGTWQRNTQVERGSGYRAKNRQTTVNSNRGSRTNERNSRVERTGDQTYQRTWDQTSTSPDGKSRTWKGEGSGSVERDGNSATRNYDGTVTTPKGQEYGVDKSSTRTKTESGWESDHSKTITDSDGNVVGTGERSSTGSQGQGRVTTGSWSNNNTSQTRDYNRRVRWQYVDGRWVKTAENASGASSTVTVDEK